MLTWLTGRKHDQRTAQRLYEAIVAQSRLPVFYESYGVPDSVTGRFEMIVLHMFLVLERLDGEPEDAARAARIGQALNEAFVSDMDSAMREMGVADIRVSKRMHQAAGAFFGRLMAYRKAIEVPATPGGATDPLAAAIMRNVLAERTDDASAQIEPEGEAAAAIAAYMREAALRLASMSYDRLMAGSVPWPDLAVSAASPSR